MKQNRCKDCHWWKDGDAFEIQSDGKFLPCTNIGVDGWEYWLDTQQEPEDCDGYCKRGEYVPSGVWAGVAKLLTALEMEISALRARQEQESKPLNEWISVKDRLPEEDDNYIVTACDEGCSAGEGIWYSTVVVVAEYYKGSWTWYDGGREYSLEGIVTHWMPMPEPPEEP